MYSTDNWGLFTTQGKMLLQIAQHPGCTVEDLCRFMFLTPRSIYGLVGELGGAGFISVRKNLRRSHYSVNPEATFECPGKGKVRLVELVGMLVTADPASSSQTVKPQGITTPEEES